MCRDRYTKRVILVRNLVSMMEKFSKSVGGGGGGGGVVVVVVAAAAVVVIIIVVVVVVVDFLNLPYPMKTSNA